MNRTANGVTLNSIEFNELCLLLKCYNPKDRAKRLADPDEGEPDYSYTLLYRSLRDKGMIAGRDNRSRFIFDDITIEGEAFVRDCKEAELDQRRTRRHDYLVAIVGALAGALFGFLSGYLSGQIGAAEVIAGL